MPTTLTLKNIPDFVYDRLKLSAEAHRRSMNSEGRNRGQTPIVTFCDRLQSRSPE